MKKKNWIGMTVAALLLVSIIIMFVVSDFPTYSPTMPAKIEIPDKTAEVAPPPVPQQTAKPNTKPPVSKGSSDSSEPVQEDDYLVELKKENEFIKEAMETIPQLVEVDVHEPGVVFFRHQPDRPEALEQAMKDLAGLYRDRLGYDKPVNVVFFISGRPVRSKVFFRE
jgi:hypothetical protein